jgi:mono/diheme cytochrome c family protein
MRLLLLLAVLGCDPSYAADTKPKLDGETLYMRACAACHQPDGRGMEGLYPPLVRADYLEQTSKETQIESVVKGMSGPLTVNGTLFNAPMPSSRQLDDEQVAAVLTYIRTSWGNALEPVRADEVARYRRGAR